MMFDLRAGKIRKMLEAVESNKFTVPETHPLKINAWNMNFLFGARPIFL